MVKTNKLSGYFLLLLGSVFAGQTVNAQKGFRLGLNLTPLMSKVSLLDTVPTHFKGRYLPGLAGGITMQYGFNDGLAFYTNVLYSSKGYRIQNDTNTFNAQVRGVTTNIEIPFGFFLRQKLSKQSFMRESIGMAINLNLNKEDTAFQRIPETNPFAIQQIRLKSMYMMLQIGIEFGRETDAGDIFTFGVVYRHGIGRPYLIDVINDPDSRTPLYNYHYRGSYLGLSIGYAFNLSNIGKQDEFFY
jgi:hypothetical protein